MSRPGSWTVERERDLVKMWKEGESAAEIAAALGGVTRNAVIGKVHRLDLVKRPTHSRPPAPRPRPHAPRILPRRRATPPAPAPRPHPVVVPVAVDTTPRNLALLELTEHVCRWPIGTPRVAGFCFCGADCTAGVYCAGHTRLAYNPPRTR